MKQKATPGHVGDWIEAHYMGGGQPRRGQIVDVLGAGSHEHYRVRWTDDRESIFRADGTYIRPAKPRPRR